jgi:glycolate oxidase FAD binding subunit
MQGFAQPEVVRRAPKALEGDGMVDPHLTELSKTEPTSLDEISVAVRACTGPICFNAGQLMHPFGMPVPYRKVWVEGFHHREKQTNISPVYGRYEISAEDLEAAKHATGISLDRYQGIIEHDVDDQVVVVRAGTTLKALQLALSESGQCLPMPVFEPETATTVPYFYRPIIDEIGFNLPHGLQAQCGSWRDWVLGMKVVLADGTVAKCGSKAVKNVAGYDVQKLMIGARGTLGLIAEVTLKTFPYKALPKSEVEVVSGAEQTCSNWVQRVSRSDFDAALEASKEYLTAYDRPSSTLWAYVPQETSLKRFKGDWILRAGCGDKNLEFSDPTVVRLMKRAKELFDPTNKLNPGEMGVV